MLGTIIKTRCLPPSQKARWLHFIPNKSFKITLNPIPEYSVNLSGYLEKTENNIDSPIKIGYRKATVIQSLLYTLEKCSERIIYSGDLGYVEEVVGLQRGNMVSEKQFQRPDAVGFIIESVEKAINEMAKSENNERALHSMLKAYSTLPIGSQKYYP